MLRPLACVLRLGAGLALAAGLLGIQSFGVWGRDAFDADYVDCPVAQRLPAVADLEVARTEQADELTVSWRHPPSASWEALGDLRYLARIVAIVESKGYAPFMRTAPLGATSVTFDNLPLTAELAISVALTGGTHVLSHVADTNFVLSDIAAAEAVSSMAAPEFCAPFYVAPYATTEGGVLTDGTIPEVVAHAQKTAGRFYYLGFGPAFRNYAEAKSFFRVGLAHGGQADLDRIDFSHYRLRVERDGAGEIAGFHPATVSGAFYDAQVLHVHVDWDAAALRDPQFPFATLRETARATGQAAVPALYAVRDIFPVALQREPHHAAAVDEPRLGRWSLTAATGPHAVRNLIAFAPGPHAYYDFPRDLFALEGFYTLTAWAEDTSGARISPSRSITVRLGMESARAAEPPARFAELDLLEGWTDCGERRGSGAGRTHGDDAGASTPSKIGASVPPTPLTPCGTGIALSNAQKQNPGLVRDCELLLALKDTLDPDGPPLQSWSVNTPIDGPDSWVGVTLGGTPERVERLWLERLQLTGSIPPALSGLDQLTVLNLSVNPQLSGSLPPELGDLTRLRLLYAWYNQLSGSIPAQLGNLAQLEQLWLLQNQLNGSLPPELGNLTRLQGLELSGNQLSGPIPAQLGNLTQLTSLRISSNQLSGPIPAELGNLTRLTRLRLRRNQLNGSIPAQLGNLTQLTELDLTDNQLSDAIPIQLGNLTRLTQLYLSGNQLSGSIPTQLGNLTQLSDLRITNNQLSGSIPTQLGNLTQLQYLYLPRNQLSGPIPSQLGNLTRLQYLSLETNQLSDPIPSQLGNLTQLIELDLYDNQLSGAIPAQLGNLTQLQRLYLNDNQLSGVIPSQLSNLLRLENLFLGTGNTYTGCIPAGLSSVATNDLASLGLADCS